MFPCPSCGHDNPAGAERCQRCDNLLPRTSGPTLPTPDVEERVRTLLQQDRKIEAIKVYQEATGAGLAEAKSAVEGLERIASPPPPPQSFEEELLALLRQSRKIHAIKVYRERTGVGLKEAKDAVEALAKKHGIPGMGPGCAGMLLLIVLAAGLAAGWFSAHS